MMLCSFGRTCVCLLALYIFLHCSEGTPEIDEPSTSLFARNYFDKKSQSTVGGRMCQMDGRNCGSFILGKKFAMSPWIEFPEARRRRLEYFLANRIDKSGLWKGSGDYRE